MEKEQKENDNTKTKEITKNLDLIDKMANNVMNNSSTVDGIFKNKKIKQIFNNFLKKSIKGISTLSKDTIVYQLPGIAETKYKDYDKIAIDIKKTELAIKKENEVKKNKLLESQNLEESNNDYLLSSDYYNEEIEKKIQNNIFQVEEYNILEVIRKFKKLPEKRTIEDLYITKNYLFQTKLTENYIIEFNNDKKLIDEIITFCGLEFQYQKCKKGENGLEMNLVKSFLYQILKGVEYIHQKKSSS